MVFWSIQVGINVSNKLNNVIMKKLLAFVLLIFFVQTASAASRVVNFTKEEYVRQLIDSTLSILNDQSLDRKKKHNALLVLLQENLDVNTMAKKVLGRTAVNTGEFQRFVSLYREYLLTTYAFLVSDYNQQSVRVLPQRAGANDKSLVRTIISNNQGQDISVNYIINTVGDRYKISDIETENISFISTQQNEFSGILASGNLSSLMEMMSTKVQQSLDK